MSESISRKQLNTAASSKSLAERPQRSSSSVSTKSSPKDSKSQKPPKFPGLSRVWHRQKIIDDQVMDFVTSTADFYQAFDFGEFKWDSEYQKLACDFRKWADLLRKDQGANISYVRGEMSKFLPEQLRVASKQLVDVLIHLEHDNPRREGLLDLKAFNDGLKDRYREANKSKDGKIPKDASYMSDSKTFIDTTINETMTLNDSTTENLSMTANYTNTHDDLTFTDFASYQDSIDD